MEFFVESRIYKFIGHHLKIYEKNFVQLRWLFRLICINVTIPLSTVNVILQTLQAVYLAQYNEP